MTKIVAEHPGSYDTADLEHRSVNMAIELKKPFSHYVAIEELPKTGDARKFVTVFVYQVEGTNRTETRKIEWSYSGTQEAIDQKAGVDGLTGRRQRSIEQLEQVVAREGGRVYETDGSKIPIWGTKK